jgi:hypothetical protein
MLAIQLEQTLSITVQEHRYDLAFLIFHTKHYHRTFLTEARPISPKMQSSKEGLAMIKAAVSPELLEYLPHLDEPDLLIQKDDSPQKSAYVKFGIRIADYEKYVNKKVSPPEAGFSAWAYFKTERQQEPALDIFLYTSDGKNWPQEKVLRRPYVIREEYEKLFFDAWLKVCDDKHKEDVEVMTIWMFLLAAEARKSVFEFPKIGDGLVDDAFVETIEKLCRLRKKQKEEVRKEKQSKKKEIRRGQDKDETDACEQKQESGGDDGDLHSDPENKLSVEQESARPTPERERTRRTTQAPKRTTRAENKATGSVTKDAHASSASESDLPQAPKRSERQAKNRTREGEDPSQDGQATKSASKVEDHSITSSRPSTAAESATDAPQTTIDRAHILTALWSKLGDLGMKKRKILDEVKSKKLGAFQRLNVVDADIAALQRTIEIFEEVRDSADMGPE